jgi:predicted  nucleic acid-binding Zn-ribbon protein
MFALVLGFVVASCGSKVDEAMVAEFNAKKAEAEKLIADADAGMKTMHDEHTAWSAKLDEAAKLPNADTTKIASFKAEIANHMKMAGDVTPMLDSLKSGIAAKTDNADALKAAVATLTTNIGALTANWKTLADAHSKLGADITAMLAPAAAAPAETAKEAPKMEGPKPAAKTDAPKAPTTSKGGAPKNPTTAPSEPAPAPKAPTTSKGGAPKK